VKPGDEARICRGSNPKLFCDLWRIAFGAAEKSPDLGSVGECVHDAILDTLDILPGLDEPQFLQRALSTRTEWLNYKDLPDKRAFMFFNVLSSPKSTTPTFNSENAELTKSRKDLLNTTFYTMGGKDIRILTLENYRGKGKGHEGLYRRDNNQFPEDMFNTEYQLRFRTVADCLGDHFIHNEYKSKGRYGYLGRKRLVVLDHEYIGKESSPLADDVDDDAYGETALEKLPNILLFRHKLNTSLLQSFDLESLSNFIGVSKEIVRKQLLAGHRLSDKAMARLQASIEIDEYGGATLIELPFPGEAQKRAARITHQLRILHDALAKGKNFDLNVARRRSALKNMKRGPVPLSEVEVAITRHLSATDNAAIHRLHSQLPRLWAGQSFLDDACMRRIEQAIALASGAERATAAKAKRNAAKPKEGRNEQYALQRKVARSKRRSEATNALRILERKDWSKMTLMDRIEYLVYAGIFVLCVAAFPKETYTAYRRTLAHASPDTAIPVFAKFLGERRAYRDRRREQTRLNVKRLRERNGALGLTDKIDHPIDGGIKDTAGNGSLGDHDTQQIIHEPDLTVAGQHEIVGTELMISDEVKHPAFD
jgi:hypothetical protein